MQVMARRSSPVRASFRTRKAAVGAPPRATSIRAATTIAILVPFRDQKEQDRRAQLKALVAHLAKFFERSSSPSVHFLMVVAEQSDDGCAFNRGALLNAAYLEAKKAAQSSELTSAILHDVDLLPSDGLLPWYTNAPKASQPVHIAGPSAWQKYAQMGGYSDIFFGGVTALRPADFEAANGYPNNYWGWGIEDDQLRIRVHASGGLAGGVTRPPAGAGTYKDLDRIQMLQHLHSPSSIAKHASKFNPRMFEKNGEGRERPDEGWQAANGLRGLKYAVRQRVEEALGEAVTLLHCQVELEQSAADRSRAAAIQQSTFGATR